MATVKAVQTDSLIMERPSENYILERRDIKDKIKFLKDDIDLLQAAIECRRADLTYYKDLLALMPLEVGA